MYTIGHLPPVFNIGGSYRGISMGSSNYLSNFTSVAKNVLLPLT